MVDYWRQVLIFLHILTDIILPIFVLIGLGALLGRGTDLDVRPLSRTVLYVLSPALIFKSLVTSTLTSRDVGQILAFGIVSTACVGLLAWTVARLGRSSQVEENAFILTTCFINSGNYGMPLNLFAFGEAGLERAVIFFVSSALMVNTAAVYFASRGRFSVRQSITNVFKLPMVYAMALAFLIRDTGVVVPDPLMRPITMAGDAAIPVLLIVLGIELSRTRVNRELWRVAQASAVRLVGAALIALALAGVFRLQGLTRQVCIVQASMPTAVMTIVLALEFNADPRFVTSVVFATTLASVATLTLLLAYLM